MTAIEMIKFLMEESGTTLSDFVEYIDIGTKSNVSQILSRKDLKVGTFVKMLEVMGFRLIAQNMESSEKYVIDNEEG